MKAGWKTTEFWLTICAIVVAVVTPLVSSEWATEASKWLDAVGLIGTIVAASAYALARGLAKKGSGET